MWMRRIEPLACMAELQPFQVRQLPAQKRVLATQRLDLRGLRRHQTFEFGEFLFHAHTLPKIVCVLNNGTSKIENNYR